MLVLEEVLTQGYVEWTPEEPQIGDELTISYGADGPLFNSAQLQIHKGRNGWQNVDDFVMIHNAQDTVWTYTFIIESVDYSGTIHHFDKVAMITIPETNNPNPNVTPPQVYDLISSPNPFNETTNIKFMLTQTAFVDVAIYDVKGALVKSFDTQHVTAEDEVSLQWNGKDELGKPLSNGIYLYSVKVNGQEYATKQVILMK